MITQERHLISRAENGRKKILVCSLIFLMLFHLNRIEGNQILNIYLGIMNFSAATLTGWIYSKYSYESAVVSHATMLYY